MPFDLAVVSPMAFLMATPNVPPETHAVEAQTQPPSVQRPAPHRFAREQSPTCAPGLWGWAVHTRGLTPGALESYCYLIGRPVSFHGGLAQSVDDVGRNAAVLPTLCRTGCRVLASRFWIRRFS